VQSDEGIINRIANLESILSANAFDSLSSVTTQNLRTTGNSAVDGQAQFNGLSVFSDTASFSGQAQFSGLTFFTTTATFNSNVIFGAPVEFNMPPLFNKDTAGFALVKQGDKKVRIDFDQPYITTPVVTSSITFEVTDNIDESSAMDIFNQNIQFIVTEKDQTGFTIILNKRATRNIRFSWVALGVRDAKVFESIYDGLIFETPTPEPEPTPTPPPTEDTTPPEPTPVPPPVIDETPST
jgi:hypothetical protein